VRGKGKLAIFTYAVTISETTSRLAESSVPGKPLRTKGKCLKKRSSSQLSRKQLAELKSLANLSDDAIDASDAPELLDWSAAKRGLFYRPVKQQLTRQATGKRQTKKA
jgi:hypothetical protein